MEVLLAAYEIEGGEGFDRFYHEARQGGIDRVRSDGED